MRRTWSAYQPLLVQVIVVMALLSWSSFLCRVLSLTREAVDWTRDDLKGFLGEAGLAALLTVLVLVSPSRMQKWILLLFVALMGVIQLVNHEHVLANYALVDFRFVSFLFEPAFFEGSVTGALDLGLLALVLALPLFATPWLHRALPRGRHLLPLQGLCLAFFFLTTILPRDSTVPAWRQTNPLSAGARHLWQVLTDTRPSAKEPLPPVFARSFQSDLAGEKRWPFPAHQTKNLLLLTLEGVPAGLINGQRPPGRDGELMPFLHKLSSKHFAVRSFVSQQRQTNRGQYALLCGDLPNLVEVQAKMELYANSPAPMDRVCLPKLLAREGFRTVYLQSAPISFMSKDRFMSKAGFAEIYDTRWFGGSLARSGWGVDDATFLQGVATMAQELEATGKPWFLNVMSAGTHHPYPVPEEWRGRTGLGPLEDSFAFLDNSLKEFFAGLETTKILDDTLIVITSDEAAGFDLADPLAGALTYNHVPLIVIGPGIPAMQADEVFAQSDLALSLSDYLGLASEELDFAGRSFFRHYATTRPIAFANIYSGHTLMLWNPQELSRCDNALSDCHHYEGPIFQGPYRELAPNAERVGLMATFLSHADRAVVTEPWFRHKLLQDHQFILKSKAEQQTLFLSPYRTVEPAHTLKVDLKFKVRRGFVTIRHEVVASGAQEIVKRFPQLVLGPGMAVAWDYSLALQKAYERLELRTFAWNESGDNVVIDVDAATMRIEKGLPPSQDETKEGFGYRIMGSPPTSTAFVLDGLRSNLVFWAPCTQRLDDSSRQAHSCAAGQALAFGPFLAFPAGATIRAEIELEGGSEPTLAHMDMSERSGRHLITRTPSVELQAGGKRSLHFEHTLEAMSEDLEVRFKLDAEPQAGSLKVAGLQLRVTYPPSHSEPAERS